MSYVEYKLTKTQNNIKKAGSVGFTLYFTVSSHNNFANKKKTKN